MKKSILTLVITMLALTFTMASISAHVQDPAKKEIKSEDLPAEVKNAVGDSEYAAWKAVKIYEVTSTDREGTEIKSYEIQVQNTAGATLALIYDDQGELLETKDL